MLQLPAPVPTNEYDARMAGRSMVGVEPNALSVIDNYDDEGLLSVGDLCRMFEDAEEKSDSARQLAQRDRDYYDNKQLTDDQIAELRKRGQPEVVSNQIRVKINYLVGLEKQQRTLPRGLPRTPVHEQDAHAVTDALKYVADDQGYHAVRSGVWRNMLIEGTGAAAVRVHQKAQSKPDLMAGSMMQSMAPEWVVVIKRFHWDRFFADPHSVELDFSDAGYLGGVMWRDEVDALAEYGPEAGEILNATMSTATLSDTYDDTPKWSVWADKKRKRVRIVYIWVKRDEEWYFAEFTKGGILKAGISPYKDEDGKSECELIAQSAYVDRENNRYGEVRAMVSPQDEINKRRSKALHLLNTAQTVYEDGAVPDEDVMRREAVRPDGNIKLNPGMMDKFKFETRTDLATGQMQLLQASQADLSLMGPNASMQGDQGKEASGRAILASQQGGMIEMGDLLDNLRHFDKRVFRAIWSRIRQFWDAPKWIRVTDDQRNVRFAPINGAIDPQTGQPGPMVGQLDVDILIDDAPDGVAPQMEQFQALVEAKKMDTANEIPFRVLLQAMPNLRDKDKLLQEMDERQQAAAQQPNPEQAKMQAEMQAEQMKLQAGMQAEQQRNEAMLQLKQAEMAMEAQRGQQQDEMEERKAQALMLLKQQEAQATMEIERQKAENDMEIARMRASADMQIKREMMAQTNEGRTDRKPQADDGGNSTAQMIAALSQQNAAIVASITAPKTLVRDQQGRPIGIKTA